MKKTIAIAAVLAAFAAVAAPRGGRGPAPRGHRAPAPVVVRTGGHHHHGHHSAWGRGGSHFWPNFVGSVVGGVIADTLLPRPAPVVVAAAPIVAPAPVVVTPAPVVVPPAPVVVTPPPVVVAPQTVWVEGRYIDQIQPNGTIIRVWQPGHYEQR